MKKKWIVIIMLQVICYMAFTQTVDVSMFLDSYFLDEEYQLITSMYGKKEVNFALNYRDTNTNFPPKGPVFSRGIVFYIEGNSLTPLLYYNNNFIYTGTGEVLYNNAGVAPFYAWEIRIYSNTISMTRFGEGGDVADSFNYNWNNKNFVFERHVVDTSQY